MYPVQKILLDPPNNVLSVELCPRFWRQVLSAWFSYSSQVLSAWRSALGLESRAKRQALGTWRHNPTTGPDRTRMIPMKFKAMVHKVLLALLLGASEPHLGPRS